MRGYPAMQATLPSSTSPIPKWALILVNVVSTLPARGRSLTNQSISMAWLQLVVVNAIAGVLIYAAPITEHFETKVLDAKVGHFWRILHERHEAITVKILLPAVKHLELQELVQAHSCAMRIHVFLGVHCCSDPLLW